ncbi:MAG: bile acid:sodium symporter family protein [Deltaproteobacteria bacterium]|nr:bile acid:sodium symporter family protein [Deltaproteobacteria bacterium]MBW2496725.1 bile acid:sodium symporter family protein [Deltaproteobacteria bacterium]
MNAEIVDQAQSVAMFSLMFGMGLTLTIADFQRVTRTPTATIVGTILQLIAMPLVGIALARFFELPPLLAAGLIVVAACPGGMFSNIFVHIARGHTALSITLTATATIVTLFTMPLWVRVRSGGPVSASETIEMPVLDTALQLGMLTVLPVLLGMVTRHRWPTTLAWEKPLSRVGALAIIVTVVLETGGRPELPVEEFRLSVLPVSCLIGAAVVLGIGIPLLFRLSTRDAVTIATELVVKNGLLGMVLVSRALDYEAVIPVLIFALAQAPVGILLLAGWRIGTGTTRLAPTPDGPTYRSD